MSRILALLYGVVCYVFFLGVFLYAIPFIGGFLFFKNINEPVKDESPTAWVINSLLLAAFALQHSVMARPGFKQWWTKFIPQPIERATYVLMTNIVMVVLFMQWRPIAGVVWDVQHPTGRDVLWGVFALGWLIVLVTTFLINHFDLFGLRQVWLYFRGKEYTNLTFRTPGPYRFIRHPLYVGWMTAFWAIPTMTVGHLYFALGCTAYMLIEIVFEERDLIAHHGDTYVEYTKRTGKLLPKFGGGK
jgi:protein-S-isoprenylcysteine O-methyltransferase Ste14